MSLIKISTLRTWSSIPDHESFLVQVNNLKKSILSKGTSKVFLQSSSTSNALVALIGKELDKEVYKIDLTSVVSKYIYETEKNIGRVFEKAENTDWLLYFDEADDLFGKRADLKPGHDKYTGLYVPYLLNKIDAYKGLVMFSCIKCSRGLARYPKGLLLKYPPEAKAVG